MKPFTRRDFLKLTGAAAAGAILGGVGCTSSREPTTSAAPRRPDVIRFYKPQDYHRGTIERAIAELNALPPIKERARLTIGDVLAVSTTPHASEPYWTLDVVGDSILMSFDVD